MKIIKIKKCTSNKQVKTNFIIRCFKRMWVKIINKNKKKKINQTSRKIIMMEIKMEKMIKKSLNSTPTKIIKKPKEMMDFRMKN